MEKNKVYKQAQPGSKDLSSSGTGRTETLETRLHWLYLTIFAKAKGEALVDKFIIYLK